MVARIETLKKYTEYLNSILDTMTKKGSMSNVIDYTRRSGVDTHLFAHLVKRGTFLENKRNGMQRSYSTNRTNLFTEEELSTILSEMDRGNKHLPARTSSQEENKQEEKCSLKLFTSRELIEELKHRGYSGTLIVKKEIKF